MSYVIDENVLVVANQRGGHGSAQCVLSCIDLLEACSTDESLVLDADRLILGLYEKHCNHRGSPGMGDQFFVWAHNNAALLRSVPITSDEDGLPVVPAELAEFDRDDRVYVATTIAASPGCTLVNAVDSDYSHRADDLAQVGVAVLELCAAELKPAPRLGRR